MLKKILLKGGQPLQTTKKVIVEDETYTLIYPEPEAWLRVKAAMFDGSIAKISLVNYNEKIIKAIVEEKVNIYELEDEELAELKEEINTFVNEVEDEDLEIELQAQNTRWKMLAKDKYLLNGAPDFVGYTKDALKNVSVSGVKLSELSTVQASQVREEVEEFFRGYKRNRKQTSTTTEG